MSHHAAQATCSAKKSQCGDGSVGIVVTCSTRHLERIRSIGTAVPTSFHTRSLFRKFVKAATERRYSLPPTCIPNVCSISAALPNRITHGERRQEHRYDAIVSERHAVRRMTYGLKTEVAIAELIKKLLWRKPAHRVSSQPGRRGP